MAAGQNLRGLVGQDMSGRKKRFRTYSFVYPPGTYTWVCPANGFYLMTMWGGGGNTGGGSPSASGSFSQMVVSVSKGQLIAVVVGVSGPSSITLPTGRVMTAGAGSANTPGVATGGDINLPGSVGGSGSPASDGLGGNGGHADVGATGGAGAPGRVGFRGADGGSGGPAAGASAGAGDGPGLAVITRQETSVLA